jgi:hypothetical protein
MIFSRDHVSCYDFDDCHDEITIVGVNFGLYLQGEGCFREPRWGQRLQVIDLIIDDRREEIKVMNLHSMSYVI